MSAAKLAAERYLRLQAEHRLASVPAKPEPSAVELMVADANLRFTLQADLHAQIADLTAAVATANSTITSLTEANARAAAEATSTIQGLNNDLAMLRSALEAETQARVAAESKAPELRIERVEVPTAVPFQAPRAPVAYEMDVKRNRDGLIQTVNVRPVQ